MGLAPDEAASPEQLLIAIRADDDDALAAADRRRRRRPRRPRALDRHRHGRPAAHDRRRARRAAPTVRRWRSSACPGQYAVAEAADAIAAGRSVLRLLRRRPGRARGRAQATPRTRRRAGHGPRLRHGDRLRRRARLRQRRPPGRRSGLVAASGTGAQQVSCLLDAAGVGRLARARRRRPRPLRGRRRACATLDALAALDADPATERVLLVSKPPAPSVEAVRVGRRGRTLGAGALRRPLGRDARPDRSRRGAAARHGTRRPPLAVAPGTCRGRGPGRDLKGLYSGGTLADEAMLLAAPALGDIRSNTPLRPELDLGHGPVRPGPRRHRLRGRRADRRPRAPDDRPDAAARGDREPRRLAASRRCCCSTSSSATGPTPIRRPRWCRR